MDCLFCKIAAGEIPSAKVYEDDRVLVFKDINPVAPVHLLAIPKEHIQSVDAVDASNCELVGYIFTVIAKVAKEQGLTNGYRVVSNIGADGGSERTASGTSISWAERNWPGLPADQAPGTVKTIQKSSNCLCKNSHGQLSALIKKEK